MSIHSVEEELVTSIIMMKTSLIMWLVLPASVFVGINCKLVFMERFSMCSIQICNQICFLSTSGIQALLVLFFLRMAVIDHYYAISCGPPC